MIQTPKRYRIVTPIIMQLEVKCFIKDITVNIVIYDYVDHYLSPLTKTPI